MLSVLNVGNWAEQYSTIGERAFLSITMTLVGISIVIVILILLNVVVSFMSRLINGKAKDKAPAAAVVPATQEETPSTPASEEDDAVIAAISAAVHCMMSESGSPSAGFKIRRIRRV